MEGPKYNIFRGLFFPLVLGSPLRGFSFGGEGVACTDERTGRDGMRDGVGRVVGRRGEVGHVPRQADAKSYGPTSHLAKCIIGP